MHDVEAAPFEPPLPARAVRRITVEQYERMAAQGFFEPDERAELLEGVIYSMSPQADRHALLIERLTVELVRALADRYRVRVQMPFRAGEDSEPEPDLLVAPPAVDLAEAKRHPRHGLLAIEVSDSTLAFDRSVKAHIYAAAGIPEYWIVNLPEDCVEVYRDPDPAAARYRSLRTVRPGDTLGPSELPGPTLSLAALMA